MATTGATTGATRASEQPGRTPAPSRTLAAPRRITILGATGSVGRNTLDLIGRDPSAFEVVALTANGNAEKLAALAIAHKARLAVVGDANAYADLKSHLAGTGIEAAAGPAALVEAALVPVD